MNILTQYSLTSMIYLAVIVISALYNKFGKREKLKEVLKKDVAPVALILLIGFNVLGLILWLVEMI